MFFYSLCQSLPLGGLGGWWWQQHGLTGVPNGTSRAAHTHKHTMYDPYYQQCKHRVRITTLKSLKHKGLPIRKHTFFHSYSHTNTLSRAFECNHAIVNCTSLSKHRQGKDHQRERRREKERECRPKGNEKKGQTFRKMQVWARNKPDAASL